MTDQTPRMGDVKMIQTEVTKSQYQVNVAQVADAILKRLLDGRSIK